MLWALLPSGVEISGQLDLIVAFTFISVLGIPHGAVDHVLFMQQHPDVKPLQFHLRYWAAIGLNLLVWVFFPVLGYISFMLISAFHFGESQFSHYKLPQSLFKMVFQFLWGLSMLAGMTFFNLGEIQVHMASDSSFMVFSGINNSIGPLVLLVLGLVGVLAGLVYLLLSR